MTDATMPHGSPDWVIEPTPAGRTNLHLAVGSEVELSAEARAHLERLVRLLQEDEVTGFAAGGCMDLNRCTSYSCTLDRCQPLEKMPCAFRLDCVVADIRR
jgi:hypothetical protein